MRFKRVVGIGIVAGLIYGIWRAWQARVPSTDRTLEWQSAPFPFPPVPRPVQPLWVDGNDAGECPTSHPIKGKSSSGIYHVPGGANYERTHADRCYLDEDAALRDGLRRSKV